MAYIKCENVSLAYEGQTVVSDLNFEVNKGDYLCIVGENGSGKSTLVKAMLGLKNVGSGKITLGDGLGRNEIGYLPQQTVVQRDFPAVVEEIVLSGCLSKCGFRPFYNKAEKKLAKDNLKRLEIEDLAGRCYRELSGGQQQRVLLARALCATGKLLLLDEPVTGLDPKLTKEFYDIVEDLNKKDEITVVMVSHDVNAAVKYASHILHVGTQLFFGTKEDYLKTQAGKEFIGTGSLV
ncbi:MAG: metal ABC transporter ATP-binding protein [Lachnospiraceae bacterium]|nr:metal ABC transporter ATP-binding protein [Lachnospiraceae bacterium]